MVKALDANTEIKDIIANDIETFNITKLNIQADLEGISYSFQDALKKIPDKSISKTISQTFARSVESNVNELLSTYPMLDMSRIPTIEEVNANTAELNEHHEKIKILIASLLGELESICGSAQKTKPYLTLKL